MNNKLRQEILKELKYLLKEQIFIGDKSSSGLTLSSAQEQQIKSSPEEAANYLYNQNNSGHVNVDEAKFAAEALSTINTPELANRFLNQWKKIAGNISISLTGSFIGEGNVYQKQVGVFGKEIQRLAASGISATPSVASDQSSVEAPGQTLKISCKRCRGVGKGCSGAAVKEVQDILIKLKFIVENNEELNSQKFGDFTEGAVKKFQQSKKIKDDGVVGPRTCVAMGLMKPAVKPAAATQADKPLASDFSRGLAVYKFAQDFGDLKGSTTNSTTKESINKDYYDNKKLNEAKSLFNKLLKNV